MNKEILTWNQMVDKVFIDKGIHPNNNKKSKIIRMFYNTFLKDGWYYHSIYGDGIKMLEVLSGSYSFARSLDQNWRTSTADLIPALKNNKTWAHMLQPLVNVTMKGVGVGEMFLTLAHPQAVYDSAKDLVIENKVMECKKDQGGCLKGNEKSNHRVVDRLRRELGLAKQGKSERLEVVYQAIFELPMDKQAYFWKSLYPKFTNEQIKSLMSLNGNDINEARFAHGVAVLHTYKNIDDFDALLLISDEEKPNITFIGNFKDETFMKNNIKFTPKLWRGGDTNAVGDGYVVISTQKAA